MAKTAKSTKKPGKSKSSANTSSRTPKTKAQPVVKTVNKKTSTSGKIAIIPDTLKRLHIATIFIYLALIAAVLLTFKPMIYPVSAGFVTKDALLSSTDNPVLVPAERTVFDLDLRFVMIVLLGLGIGYSLLVLTRWRASYVKSLNTRIYLWHWVYFALAGKLLAEMTAVIGGVEDVAAIKLAGMSIIFAAAFAWFSERQNLGSNKPVWSGFYLAIFASLFSWLSVKISVGGSLLWGMVNLPWFVYATLTVFALGILLVAENLYLSLKKQGENYTKTERNHVLLSLVVQTAFVIIAGLGFLK